MVSKSELKISQYLEMLQSLGKNGFALESIQKELPHLSMIAIKSALSRQTRKGNIISIHKGYYLIIPPQYKSKGILPPPLFLDRFMDYLERPYYLGLLNAAAYHGASHQQPQEFYVVTVFPVVRPTLKKGLKISYISKKEIPNQLLEIKKTESGYLKISNPILTALDLVQFEKRVGGLNRVAVILNELMESIKPGNINQELLKFTSITTFQRLGYLMDHVLQNNVLSAAVYKIVKKENLFRIPLKTSAPTSGFLSNEKWKVIVNTEIKLEE